MWLLLPHEAGRALPLAFVCLLAQAVGSWMRRGAFDEAPRCALKAIVAAIVEIARSLGLQVIAEGVEGELQLERLRRLGCHGAQGYLFSGPLPPDAFAAFLAAEEHEVAVA